MVEISYQKIRIIKDVSHSIIIYVMVFCVLSYNRDLVVDQKGYIGGPIEYLIIKLV